jgi:hypothetical protein
MVRGLLLQPGASLGETPALTTVSMAADAAAAATTTTITTTTLTYISVLMIDADSLCEEMVNY